MVPILIKRRNWWRVLKGKAYSRGRAILMFQSPRTTSKRCRRKVSHDDFNSLGGINHVNREY